MKYNNVVIGKFIARPNRFIAHVELDGEEVVCHVKNTGRCRELLIPGAKVVLSVADNPARKTKYDLIAVWKDEMLVNIDSQAPNAVFAEWARSEGFPAGLTELRPETRYGNSRFDFYYRACFEEERQSIRRSICTRDPEDEVGRQIAAPTTDSALCARESGAAADYDAEGIYNSRNSEGFIEVKGVTLESGGVARFPDAPTLRGAKHVRELISCAEAGYGAYIAFVVQMQGMKYVTPNAVTDPDFAAALREAAGAGVKIIALECAVTEDTLEIIGMLPFCLD